MSKTKEKVEIKDEVVPLSDEQNDLAMRGKMANDEIAAVLAKYHLGIQAQVEQEALDAFVKALKVRLVDKPNA